jgi:hypothetical protein
MEYSISIADPESMEQILNEYGRAGWHTRAFNYMPTDDRFWALLERQVPEPPPDRSWLGDTPYPQDTRERGTPS